MSDLGEGTEAEEGEDVLLGCRGLRWGGASCCRAEIPAEGTSLNTFPTRITFSCRGSLLILMSTVCTKSVSYSNVLSYIEGIVHFEIVFALNLIFWIAAKQDILYRPFENRSQMEYFTNALFKADFFITW